jgi:hypothetical protein
MALFQSLAIVALLTFMSSNRASYGITASPRSFRISPGTPFGHIDLFLAIADSCFLIILMLMVNGSHKASDVHMKVRFRSVRVPIVAVEKQ